MPRPPSPTQIQALFKAAQTNDEPALRLALKKVSPQETNSVGRTPLMWAAEHGALECLRVLLPISDPNALTLKMNTALSLASYFGFVDCVTALIQNGAKTELADSGGNTPLMTAIRANQLDCVKLLLPSANEDAITRDENLTFIGVAAAYGSVAALELLAPLASSPACKRRPEESLLEIATRLSRKSSSTSWLASRATEAEIKRALSRAVDRGHVGIFDAIASECPESILFSEAKHLARIAKNRDHHELAAKLAALTEAALISEATLSAAARPKSRL